MTRLCLLAHGSRDPRWRAPLERLVEGLRAELGEVRLGYLDHAEPRLLGVAEEAARDGVGRLVVWPLFISAGGHTLDDVPQKVAEAQAAVPAVKLELVRSIGEEPAFAQLVGTLARAHLGRS